MASLIPGYYYDVFISYRQKDNKYDGWVTEFVDNLKKELEATFKEEISVYFDINPHDGLLETHDVDASLKEKLKCLVFISIISRTYCDPKSFAWEHEFKAFVALASKDQFGLKVKLPNGNVASRVLPVRIHDLDVADIKECESVLGGVLRGIEFIYKEAGIDKPLAQDDDEKNNINKTKYRIQIIKVAHAIKEIILGMKNEPAQAEKEKEQPKESVKEVREEEKKIEKVRSTKERRVKVLYVVAVAMLLLIAGIFVYPKIFKRNTIERLRTSGERISIAVMPFRNMTNDTTWNIWQKGIQDNLIISLSNSRELKLGESESINGLLQSRGLTNYASLTPAVAVKISRTLDANVFIYGSINQAGSKIRLNAQISDTKTEEVLKSFQIEGSSDEENIFHIIDSISSQIGDFLLVTILKKNDYDFRNLTYKGPPLVLKYYIYGENTRLKGDPKTAIIWYMKALSIDSTYTNAIRRISLCYYNIGMYEEAKKWCIKLKDKSVNSDPDDIIKANLQYAILFETPYECIKYLKQLLDLNDQSPGYYCNLGSYYNNVYQYENAIPECEKSLEIYKNLNLRPSNSWYYRVLLDAYHGAGQYRKEKKLYRKAEQDFPNNEGLIYRHAILSLTEGDTALVNQYIEKYKSILKENSASEATIATNLAYIYTQSGILSKAEEYYRNALSLANEKLGRMNNLAYFLIDKDRNIKEGLELADSLLKLRPDNYFYLHTKGWGLYKCGKYKEAVELLQKSWDKRREKAIYNHAAFLHLEEAKKAVAGQKNN